MKLEKNKYANTVLPGFMSCAFSRYYTRAVVIVFLSAILWIQPEPLSAIEISDTPLETAIYAPPPNVVLVLDNSGSMDWEFMTQEGEGLFQDKFYLFPQSAYGPSHDHQYSGGRSLTPTQRRMWKSQWAGYNRLYFDPDRQYSPWPATHRHPFGQADLDQPWSNPVRSGRGDVRIDMAATYFTIRSGEEEIRIANAHYYTFRDLNANDARDPGEDIYLVAWVDEDGDGSLDVSGNVDADQRRYFRFIDDGDDLVEENELIPVTDEAEKNRVRPVVVDANGQVVRVQTDRDTLQNFANWCCYYRRRFFTLKAVTADTILNLSQANIGLFAVNGDPRLGVRPAAGPADSNTSDGTSVLLDALYAMPSGGLTPLRSALDRVGRYFSQETNAGFDQPLPTPEVGAACQRHLALVVSDGFWNGQFSGVGNADGDNGAPFADRYADTLADVAAHYYENDLRPDLEDAVSSNGCAEAVHQHMITMALTFGFSGTIDMEDVDGDRRPDRPGYRQDPCFDTPQALTPGWPQPVGLDGLEAEGTDSPGAGTGTGERLDDLWHATINGHGACYPMAQAEVVQRQILSGLPQAEGGATATGLTLNRDLLTETTIRYSTSYEPESWQGDLTAWALGEGGNDFIGQPLWRASDQFGQAGFDWGHRKVVTYGGLFSRPQGVPFRYDHLSEVDRSVLSAGFRARQDETQLIQDLIEYLRGASFPQFRERTQLLGDMVHSAPVVSGNTLFVGANDGMLHAFDAGSGQERFAYVPNLIFDHLKALSDPAYPGHHRFYVDGPLSIGDVVVGPYQRHTYLVGGLGKGGRGYFCLLVGNRHRSRSNKGYGDYQWDFHLDQLGAHAEEEQVSKVVQWEYPRPDTASDGMDNNSDGVKDEPGETDPDMGYSFGQGYAVNANCAQDNHRAVVIFGNGYDSPGQSAVLFVLRAETGEVLRKIHTGAVGNNGLSTPALIDVDMDNRIDYAYAGDLQGNMWKFDLTSEDPHKWGVAYGEDLNGDNVIDAHAGDLPRPLFQATDQPITSRPDVMAMANACNPEANGYMLIFGTGRYLAVDDPGSTSQQSLYGLWDYGDDSDDSEHLGFLLDRSRGYLSSGLSLVRQEVTGQTNEDGATTRQISQNPVNYRTEEDRTDPNQKDDPRNHVGWFLDFPIAPDPLADPGERVIAPVTLRGGKAVVNTLVPKQIPCRSGSSSWVYVLNGCDGSQPEAIANTIQGAKRYRTSPFSKPVIVKDPTRPHLDQIVLLDPTGGIITEAFVGEFWGRAYWWQNID